MAKTVTLSNGREFSSQKAATEHFRAVLHCYGNGEEITDPAHHSDLVALLERYDAAITSTPSKIGTGIVRFERRINYGSGFATAGFWVERTDGSWTDFSFPTAISAKPKPAISGVRRCLSWGCCSGPASSKAASLQTAWGRSGEGSV